MGTLIAGKGHCFKLEVFRCLSSVATERAPINKGAITNQDNSGTVGEGEGNTVEGVFVGCCVGFVVGLLVDAFVGFDVGSAVGVGDSAGKGEGERYDEKSVAYVRLAYLELP